MQAPALPPGTTQRTLAIIMGGGAGTRLFPANQRSRQASRAARRKISPRRYPDQQLPQLRAALDLRPDAVQQHVAASPHPGELQIRQFFAQLRRYPRRAANARQARNGIREPPTRCGKTCATSSSGRYEYYLILSGDQLYRMDFRTLLHQHIRSGADITLATKPVKRESGLGVRHHAERRGPPHHAVCGEAEGCRRCWTR